MSDTGPTVAQAIDEPSVAIYGARDNVLGFPRTDLAFAYQADGDQLARRILNRYSRIVTHIDPVQADTLVDPGWLPVLAGLDTGAAWSVVRVHPTRWELPAVVVGIAETITPDRIEATVNTTSTTPT